MRMVEERRKSPTDDIVSVIANATLDGQHPPPIELLSFYYLLVVAGNETTRNATSGALLALIQNPGELEKLKRSPELIPKAVEEVVRWTTPVIQFCRTPLVDSEVRGQKIRAGQAVCLFYPSANRDEDVFPDGDVFRVDRDPNRTSASASASTSAWARTWRGSSSRWCCSSSSPASRRSSWPGPCADCARASSAA